MSYQPTPEQIEAAEKLDQERKLLCEKLKEQFRIKEEQRKRELLEPKKRK